MDLGFEGHVVVVAGASGELGNAICRRLISEGADVVLLGRDEERLRELSVELSTPSAEVGYLVADLDDDAGLDAALASLYRTRGVPHVLITAAGSTERVGVDRVDTEDFKAAMESKFYPNVRLVLAVGRAMTGVGRGRIVVVSGIGGVQPMDVHLAGGSANAALSLFAGGYARTLASAGVQLNVVNPGAIKSPRLQGHFEARAQLEGISIDAARASLLSEIPVGREGSPQEIADVIVFVASARSSYLVATSVNVDGGQVIGR
jgi:NAD(P)-dependent dehydrogenase (short-subunit alcohol dehydrogenase family)